MIRRRVLISSVILCLAGLFCWQAISIRAEDSGGTTSTVIAFNDPAYAEYFRYQVYLVTHGKTGYVQTEWDKLPADVRIEKIAKQEIILKNLKKELTDKPVLTAQEKELFDSVWGKPQDSQQAAATAAAEKAKEQLVESSSKTFTSGTVNTIGRNLPQYQQSGNWDKFFDGSKTNGGAVDLPEAVNMSGHSKTNNLVISEKPTPKSIIVTPLPESNPEQQPASSKTSAIVGGALLALAAIAFAGKKIKSRVVATADEFDLDIRLDNTQTNNPTRWTFGGGCGSYGGNCVTKVNTCPGQGDTCDGSCATHCGTCPKNTCDNDTHCTLKSGCIY
jgi:uncharacterized coiled-coil protein SlyX